MPAPDFQFVDERTARSQDGTEHDVRDAIAALPWVLQLCPLMGHEYAILSKSPEWAWFALEAMLRKDNPATYRAYFRGYQSANRYWDAPDGWRYWRGRFEIDRSRLETAEPLRRVDEGAKRIEDWDGPLWAPSGSGLYEELRPGKW